MYVLHYIFLLASLISRTLATPPPRPNDILSCYDGTPGMPNPDDCTRLLEGLSNLDWVKQRTTYGRRLPQPGQIPFSERYRSCELTLENAQFMSDEIGTFRLVQYFPKIYEIIRLCLMQEPPFSAGMVHIARGNKFIVILSGLLSGNETVGWEEASRMGTVNRIPIA